VTVDSIYRTLQPELTEENKPDIPTILERSIEETVKKKERKHIDLSEPTDSKDVRIESFTLDSQSTIEYSK